jgi:SAM-dependent methyltransferase
VLQHVESPDAVVAEVARVLRPGGIVALADADLDGFLLHPRPPGLDEAVAIDRRTRRHPDVGRRLPELLTGAGFVDVAFTAPSNVVIGPAAAALAASSAARLEAPAFVEHFGLRRDEAAAAADGWRAWGAAPGAIFVTWWCQAIGRRPEQVGGGSGSK